MMKGLLALLIFTSILFAKNGEELSKEFGLNPSEKAQMQWVRIFEKKRKMEKYGLDKLSEGDKKVLLNYLKAHSADSDSPTVPGL